MVTPLRSGVKLFGDGSSWLSWWLFNSILSDDEIADFCDDNHIGYHYGVPGQPFSRRPGISRSRTYTLIVEEGGYDV
jgi:hypothetical protein